jgi:hypothetical protein
MLSQVTPGRVDVSTGPATMRSAISHPEARAPIRPSSSTPPAAQRWPATQGVIIEGMLNTLTESLSRRIYVQLDPNSN